MVAGGSTISQQVAKLVFLSPERTVRRKIQEAMLAFWLEREFTKEEILTIYLNRAYFGAGAYGVDAAARRYFGRSAREVDLAQAAMIAGLLRAPSRYSPANDLALARRRAGGRGRWRWWTPTFSARTTVAAAGAHARRPSP